MEGEHVAIDDVDIGLGELAEPALLRSFPSPDLLDLIPAEGELQVAGVCQDVPGEGHGQVEVESEAGIRLVCGGVESPQHVDLLVDLALAEQLLQGFDRTRLD